MVEIPDFLKPLEKVTRPFPREAFEEAIAQREECVPALLEALEWSAANAETLPDDFLLHEYALRLLAQFREDRAYESAVRLARHPRAGEFLQDTLSADLGPILATLSGGDPRGIQKLIEDDNADEFARWAGFRALGVLCHEGVYPREALSVYLGELFAGKLSLDGDYTWTGLVELCANFGLSEHLEAAGRAVDDGRVDLSVYDWRHLEKRLKTGKFSETEHAYYLFFSDAIGSMEDWHCFTAEAVFEEERESAEKFPSREDRFVPQAGLRLQPQPQPQPVRVELKPGRNDPCPCGSGKKFKKCCG